MWLHKTMPATFTPMLHITGCASLVGAPRGVALVGARAATRAGMERAFQLAHGLARAGWVILSGGAVGIDAAAHRGALAAGGLTVAVVAGGVVHPYPSRNHGLFAEIVAAGGALASPFADGEGIQRWHFVRRNQTLAQLAEAVIVVEAGALSGSRYTSDAARSAGKLVGACPGSLGTSWLLHDGAACIESVDDALRALEGRPRRQVSAVVDEQPAAGRTFAVLDRQLPRTPEELAERAGISLRQVTAELVELEMDGLAFPAPGGGYLRADGLGS